jgi:hypothetical protein
VLSCNFWGEDKTIFAYKASLVCVLPAFPPSTLPFSLTYQVLIFAFHYSWLCSRVSTQVIASAWNDLLSLNLANNSFLLQIIIQVSLSQRAFKTFLNRSYLPIIWSHNQSASCSGHHSLVLTYMCLCFTHVLWHASGWSYTKENYWNGILYLNSCSLDFPCKFYYLFIYFPVLGTELRTQALLLSEIPNLSM